MVVQGFLLLVSYLLVLLVLVCLLGMCLVRMVNDILFFGLVGVECVLWCVVGICVEEMGWLQYLLVILLFNVFGGLVLFVLLMFQGVLLFNLQYLLGLLWDLVFNIVISFVSNINWQVYVGESIMSYFSQMVGLMVQNFFFVVIGIVVVFVLICVFVWQKMLIFGNVWVDLMCIILWLLLLFFLLVVLFFIQQGVLQNLQVYQFFIIFEGVYQLLLMGFVVLQEVIKLLGINGGGFFNVNFVYLFENLIVLINFVQMLVIFLILVVLCFVFGEVVSDWCQGCVILWVMMLIFIFCVVVVMWVEICGNLYLLMLGVDSSLNMEGKESCFGIFVSSLFVVIIIVVFCGVVNVMYDFFIVLGGMVLMWLMQIGEVVFGGVGLGLYGMLLFVMLVVFIVGLMVGCILEYFGKKIDVWEMKMIVFVILVILMLVLFGMVLVMMIDVGCVGMFNSGLYGFSEVLYVVILVVNNNGSVFVGLGVVMLFWNLLLVFCMLVGCFVVIILVMVIVGLLVVKKI